MRKNNILLFLSIIAVVAVSGCVSFGSLFGSSTTTVEASNDVMAVSDSTVIPTPPILTGDIFTTSFVAKNLDDLEDAQNVKVRLYDWGACAPSACLEKSKDGYSYGKDYGSISPKDVQQVECQFKAPSAQQIGGIAAKCPIRYKLTYDFSGITTTELNVISNSKFREMQRAGQTPTVNSVQSKSRGPIKVNFDFGVNQPVRTSTIDADPAKSNIIKIPMYIRVENKGSGKILQSALSAAATPPTGGAISVQKSSILPSFITMAAAASECTDTDNGENYNAKGICKDSRFEYSDYCDRNGKLVEYFCDGQYSSYCDGKIDIACPAGCNDGMCIDASPSDFDFSVSASPTSATVTQGGSLTTMITAKLKSGAAESVVFSCPSGLPAGASCKFSPDGATLSSSGTTSILTVSTSPKTPAGTYAVTISSGSLSGLKKSATFSLTVNPSGTAPQPSAQPLATSTHSTQTDVSPVSLKIIIPKELAGACAELDCNGYFDGKEEGGKCVLALKTDKKIDFVKDKSQVFRCELTSPSDSVVTDLKTYSIQSEASYTYQIDSDFNVAISPMAFG